MENGKINRILLQVRHGSPPNTGKLIFRTSLYFYPRLVYPDLNRHPSQAAHLCMLWRGCQANHEHPWHRPAASDGPRSHRQTLAGDCLA